MHSPEMIPLTSDSKQILKLGEQTQQLFFKQNYSGDTEI